MNKRITLLLLLSTMAGFGIRDTIAQSNPGYTNQIIKIMIAEGQGDISTLMPAGPGDTIQLEAVTYPTNMVVEFEIVNYKADKGPENNAGIEKIITISTNGVLTMAQGFSWSGQIKVGVSCPTNNTIASVYETYEVGGCGSCSEGTCSGSAKLGCINFTADLGYTTGNANVGSLRLYSETLPDPNNLADPELLELSIMFDDGVEIQRDKEERLESIETPFTKVAIDTNVTGVGYNIDYYFRSGFGETFSATPDKRWEIRAPGAQDTFNGLSITEVSGAGLSNRLTTAYSYEETIDSASSYYETWTMTRSSDGEVNTEIMEVHHFESGGIWYSDHTRTLLDSDDNTVSSTIAYYSENELYYFEETGSLSTYYNYYPPGSDAGRLKQTDYSDGSWVRYEYDSLGRVTKELRPWENAGSSVTDTNLLDVTVNSFSLNGDDDGLLADQMRPRTVSRYIKGDLVERTFYEFKMDSNQYVETVERASAPAASFGATGNLRTVTRHVAGLKGRIASVVHEDGTADYYTYTQGTFTPSTTLGARNYGFTASASGTDEQVIVIRSVAGDSTGTHAMSTRNVSYHDGRNGTYVSVDWIRNSSGAYVLADWTEYARDNEGRVTKSIDMRGRTTDIGYACCGEDWRKTPDGRETTTLYDGFKRPEFRTEEDGATGEDIVTEYAYDAAGRTKGEFRTAGSLSLTNSYTYDQSGRTLTHKSSDGLTAKTVYNDSTRTVTRYAPHRVAGNGPTTITERYCDGRTKSVTGTAQPAQYYSYGVNAADGSQYTEVNLLSTGGARWTKTTVDMLGRTLKEEQPATDGGTNRVQYSYNADGRLWKTEQYHDNGSSTLVARQITVYDALGNVRMQGLDADMDGDLDPASMDVVTGSGSWLIQSAGDWYLIESSTNYPYANSATNPVVTYSQIRLSGHGDETAPTGVSGTLTDERTGVDAYGNLSVSQAWTDRANKKVTRITQVPASTVLRQSISTNGYPGAVTSTAEGDWTTYGYDDLGRRTQVTDPRTGTSYTRYNAKGQVFETEDAAGYITSYGYDADYGRLESVTDPNTNTVYYTYDDWGQKDGEYGATYPVKYFYDSYGQMTDMYTYRGTNNVVDTPSEFNGLTLNDMDRTQWDYQESTGLLESKTDEADHTVEYTYHPEDHQLKTRTWARENGGITTTYSYNPTNRLLATVVYNDGFTPGITNSYTRLGQLDTVLDGQGYRKFTYTHEGALDTETVKVSVGGAVIHVIDHAQDDYGRSEGYDLFMDGSTSASLGIEYGYDAQNGRVETIEGTLGTASFYSKYYYVDNSDLLDGHSIAASSNASSFFYDRSVYEDHRNLIDRVENGFSTALNYRSPGAATRKSYYDYTNDAAGRRTARADWYNPDGTVTTQNNSFDYNEHNELESADFGADDYDYTFDNIGNRVESSKNTVSTSYEPNELNEYESVGSNDDYEYDEDGNLLADGEWICTWDAENRLTEMRTWHSDGLPDNGDTRLVFAYDYDGRRYSKTVYDRVGGYWAKKGSSCTLTWNGNHIIHEEDGLYEKNYAWGLEGKLLGMTIADYYFVAYGYDGNKNVTHIVHDAEYVSHYEYDAFGNLTSTMSAFGPYNPFRFSSEYVDNETGWVAYKYRYYAPAIGRFVNRDPIGERGGLNLYGFVGNSPSYMIDLYGMGVGSFLGDVGADFVNAGVATVRAGGEVVAWGFETSFDVGAKTLKTGSMAVGYVTSTLSGDMFDKSNIQTEFDKCQCTYLLVINGIRNNPDQAREMRNIASEKFGITAIGVKNGTHWPLGLGDFIQIAANELYIIDLPAQRAADQINAMYAAGQKHQCNKTKIIVVAHSQGTMVFNRALSLVSMEVRETIDYRGSGPQAFIGNNRGLGSVDNDWNYTKGKAMSGYDMVPLANYVLNPIRGLSFHLGGGNLDITSTAYKKGNDHNWAKFYSHNY